MNFKTVFLRNGATLCALVFLSQLLSGCLSDEEKMQRAEQKRIKYAEYLVKNAAKYKDTSDRPLHELDDNVLRKCASKK